LELDPVHIVQRAAPGGKLLRIHANGSDQIMSRKLTGLIGVHDDAEIVPTPFEQERQQREHRVAGLGVIFLPAVREIENGVLHLCVNRSRPAPVFAGSTLFLSVIRSISWGADCAMEPRKFGHTGLCIFTPSLASRRSQSGLAAVKTG